MSMSINEVAEKIGMPIEERIVWEETWGTEKSDINAILDLVIEGYKNYKEEVGYLVYVCWRKYYECHYDTVFCNLLNVDINNTEISSIESNNKEMATVIILVQENESKDILLKWLYHYMNKTEVKRGIIISGYNWNMIDFDEKEYTVNFKKEVDIKLFERFLF